MVIILLKFEILFFMCYFRKGLKWKRGEGIDAYL